MANRNYLISGITEFLVLSILEQHDSYVYEITKTIQAKSGNLIKISQNTIYTVTYKLENDGYISEYNKLVGKKRTRVYYHLEPDGLLYLKKISQNYHQMIEGVQNFLNFLQENGGINSE